MAYAIAETTIHHVEKIEMTLQPFNGFAVFTVRATDKNGNAAEFSIFTVDENPSIPTVTVKGV